MESLTITIEPIPDKVSSYIVHFAGEFDGYAKENLVDIQALIDQANDQTILIFDFEKLNYMNSFAIGHLIAWRNQLSQSGSRLYIAGTNTTVQDALNAVGSSILFIFFPDLQSAIEGL